MDAPNTPRPAEGELVFVKLGGSLITDKTHAFTVRTDVLRRLTVEVREALDCLPRLQLLIGHGSGSFGHWTAKEYGTQSGVATREEWRGFAEVGAAAARLNRIVVDAFLDAGVPVLSVPPSASARSVDGELVGLDVTPVRRALESGLVPLLFGDICWDDVRGGTIISTEDVLTYLAGRLRPDRVLILGDVPGVLDGSGNVIEHIAPEDLGGLRAALSSSRGVDVTGGMTTKVNRMVELVQRCPATLVDIASGLRPGLLRDWLLDATIQQGTRIGAAPAPGLR